MNETLRVDDLISFLNQLIEIDSYAVSALFTTRVLCNEELAEHSTVQVRQFVNDKGQGWEVGILGLINGMFGVDLEGYGPITAIVNDRGSRILEFKRTAHGD